MSSIGFWYISLKIKLKLKKKKQSRHIIRKKPKRPVHRPYFSYYMEKMTLYVSNSSENYTNIIK